MATPCCRAHSRVITTLLRPTLTLLLLSPHGGAATDGNPYADEDGYPLSATVDAAGHVDTRPGAGLTQEECYVTFTPCKGTEKWKAGAGGTTECPEGYVMPPIDECPSPGPLPLTGTSVAGGGEITIPETCGLSRCLEHIGASATDVPSGKFCMVRTVCGGNSCLGFVYLGDDDFIAKRLSSDYGDPARGEKTDQGKATHYHPLCITNTTARTARRRTHLGK